MARSSHVVSRPNRGRQAGRPEQNESILCVSDIRFPLERANGIQTVETCHALARVGARVHLLVRHLDERHGTGPPLAFYDLADHPRFRLSAISFPGPLGRLRFVSATLVEMIHGARADAVFTRDLMVAELILRLPIPHRPRLFYEAHNVSSVFAEERPRNYQGGDQPTRRKIARLDARERRVCRTADGLVTITESLRSALVRQHGPLTRSIVIPDGCRISTTPPPRPKRVGKTHVVYIGQLYPWKGVDRLIEAVGIAADCRLTIVGGLDGEPDKARIECLVSRLGLNSRVRLVGFVPPRQLEAYRRDADLFVVPNLAGSRTSEQFTSPLKLFESMAANRPIVASDLPSLGEVLRQEDNALMVPPGDARALARAIERIRGDQSLAERLAQKAYQDVQAFSWDKRAQRLRAFFSYPEAPRRIV